MPQLPSSLLCLGEVFNRKEGDTIFNNMRKSRISVCRSLWVKVTSEAFPSSLHTLNAGAMLRAWCPEPMQICLTRFQAEHKPQGRCKRMKDVSVKHDVCDRDSSDVTMMQRSRMLQGPP